MKWLVLWSLWAARLVRQPTLPLRLASSGALLRGQFAPDGSHVQYFGIPYATVRPDGRFQVLLEYDAYKSTLEQVSTCNSMVAGG